MPMLDKIIAKYDRPVPRYTSYPTAPHFHAGVDADCYGQWLRALPEEQNLSLYFHVPFCDTLCYFCGCNMRVVRKYEPVAAYMDLLFAELELVGRELGTGAGKGQRPLEHLHFGGGSPSMVSPDDLRRLGKAIWSHFKATDQAELAIEVDPRDLADETVYALADMGINRASIGVQDVNPDVQKACNRFQPPEVTASAVNRLRAVGIDAINLDLMYGLPLQTVAGVERSVEVALELNPNRVSLFGYAHVPHMKKHQLLMPVEALPETEERFEQAETAARILVEAGYRRIGLDHFARPDDAMALALDEGQLHRNFQGYTTDAAPALIGLGASAIGSLPQGYQQNHVGMPEYRKAVQAGILPVARGVAVTPEDLYRRSLIEGVMCDLAVDLAEVAKRFPGQKLDLSAEKAQLAAFAQDGVITWDGNRLDVTEPGRTLVRAVAAVFDSYLKPDEGRHSRAV
ncbi:oxygen-independent coproporphyrinogen III oxidase [Rhodovibrionaceae bacterium A322]